MAAHAPPIQRSAAKSGATAPPKAARDEGRKAPVQAKLKVGGAHDPQEREADRMADRVMGSTAPSFPMAAHQSEKVAQRATAAAATRLEDKQAQGSAAPGKPEIRRAPKDDPSRKTAQRSAKKEEPKVQREAKRDPKAGVQRAIEKKTGKETSKETTGPAVVQREGTLAAGTARARSVAA